MSFCHDILTYTYSLYIQTKYDIIWIIYTNQLNNYNMNYNVQINYFADKVYTNTDIQTILHEIAIFTDIENIISITKLHM